MREILLTLCVLFCYGMSQAQLEPLIIDLAKDEALKIVKEKPRFPGCEVDSLTSRQKSSCAREKLTDYIKENLVYPQAAKDKVLEGTCVVQFVVLKDGRIANAKVLRDIGLECGQAALDVINSLNDLEERWIPGIQNGEAVNVYFTVPITFDLERKNNWERAIRKGGE